MPKTTKPKLCPLPAEIAAMLIAPQSYSSSQAPINSPKNALQEAYASIYYTAINHGLQIPLTM
jgi:hypothetical protein